MRISLVEIFFSYPRPQSNFRKKKTIQLVFKQLLFGRDMKPDLFGDSAAQNGRTTASKISGHARPGGKGM